MPASYHWEPPASTLAHCLAVIHPNQDVLAKGCLACRRQNDAICKTPSTSPTPGQRCADWTTRPPKWRKPDVQSMGRARFCKTTFTKQQTCTNSPKGNSFWKSEIPRKGPPLQDRILTQCKSSYMIYSNMSCPVSRSERPPLQHASQLPLGTPSEHLSALSRCHTSQSGCVGQRVSSLQKAKRRHLQNSQHEPHTRPTVCGLNN